MFTLPYLLLALYPLANIFFLPAHSEIKNAKATPHENIFLVKSQDHSC